MKFYTYELRDPQTHEVFYVGKGTGKRMYLHEQFTRSGRVSNHNQFLFNKIHKLLELYGKIECDKVLETDSEQEAFDKESELIQAYRVKGIKLCNITDGGEGCSGLHVPASDERKKKIGDALRGREKSDSHKQKLRDVKLANPVTFWEGKSFSEDHRKRLSETKKAFYATPEGQEALSARVAKWKETSQKTVMYNGETFIGNWGEIYAHFGFSRFLRKGLIESGALKILEKD